MYLASKMVGVAWAFGWTNSRQTQISGAIWPRGADVRYSIL